MLTNRLKQLHDVFKLLNSPAEKLLLALDKKDLLEFEYGIIVYLIWYVMSCDL